MLTSLKKKRRLRSCGQYLTPDKGKKEERERERERERENIDKYACLVILMMYGVNTPHELIAH